MKLLSRLILKLDRMELLTILPTKLYLQLIYKIKLNKKLDLDNPQTFNEKLQWLKINNIQKNYSLLVNKYTVKNYIGKVIGEEYIIPTLGIYDKFEDINFDDLPEQFVIKCTHDSGGIVVCKDKSKLDKDSCRIKIKKCLKRNYYLHGREYPYKTIKPQIIIEKYMEDENLKELRDYKFFCFNGEPKCFKIDFDRFVNHRANYYDMNQKILNVGEKNFPPDFNKNLLMPINFDKMVEFAKKISRNIPFARVDFYEVNNKVFFGEITFFPASGMGKFINEYSDELLGSWLQLPIK